MRKKSQVHQLALNALVAAIYAALTIALGFMSYGGVQFRVAEALCVLPFFFPNTVWGLFLGCVIANLLSPVGILDVIFGSLASLGCCVAVAALGCGGKRGWGRSVAACAMPVVFNGVVVGALLAVTLTPGEAFLSGFLVFGAQVAFGEAVVMAVLGLPLIRLFPKSVIFRRMNERLCIDL